MKAENNAKCISPKFNKFQKKDLLKIYTSNEKIQMEDLIQQPT